MQSVVLIRGPLGVGKTTVAKAVAKKLHAAYFSIDRILEELQLDKSDGECIPAKNFIAAQEHVLPQIKDALRDGQAVVIDGNFYHKEQIEYFNQHVEGRVQIFTLHSSIEICIERDSKRKKPYGEDAARAVHSLVSRFDAGTVIDTTNKSALDSVQEIVGFVGPIKVRTAMPKDAPRIAEIHVETWQHAYRGQVPDAFLDNLSSTLGERTKKWQETLLKRQRGMRVFVAEMGKQIVGFCIVNPCRDEDMDKKAVGELGAIYIDARYMNRGVGSALLKESLGFLKKEGFNKATLWVLDSNEKARKWYESKGWKVEGKTKVDDRNDVQLHEVRYQITL